MAHGGTNLHRGHLECPSDLHCTNSSTGTSVLMYVLCMYVCMYVFHLCEARFMQVTKISLIYLSNNILRHVTLPEKQT